MPSHPPILGKRGGDTRALLAAYFDAAPADLEAGRTWYPAALAECRRVARIVPDFTPRQIAGVMAALSPRVQWHRNLQGTRQIVQTGSTSVGLPLSRERAAAILAGGRPLDVLGGPKVRAFYRAITGNTEATVIDVWAARAAGVPAPTTSADYATLTETYRAAARLVYETPRDFQAIVWCAIRGKDD